MTVVYYTLHNQPLAPDLFNYYFDQLSITEKQKINKLRRYQDQQASLLGKILLLKGLVKFGYEKKLLKEIIYTEYKRPFINVPVDFNISHSGKLVVCAMGNDCRVGIDVEEIRAIKPADFRDIFSADEYNKILLAKNDHKEFFNTWTKKEAVSKANGKGLYIPFKEIIPENDIAFLENETWYLKKLYLSEDYAVSLASNTPHQDDLLLIYIDKEKIVVVD